MVTEVVAFYYTKACFTLAQCTQKTKINAELFIKYPISFLKIVICCIYKRSFQITYIIHHKCGFTIVKIH